MMATTSPLIWLLLPIVPSYCNLLASYIDLTYGSTDCILLYLAPLEGEVTIPLLSADPEIKVDDAMVATMRSSFTCVVTVTEASSGDTKYINEVLKQFSRKEVVVLDVNDCGEERDRTEFYDDVDSALFVSDCNMRK